MGCDSGNQLYIAHDKVRECLTQLQVSPELIKHSQQLIYVKTSKWSSTTGTCFLLEKQDHNWQVIEQFDVVVGKNGLKWGQGVHLVESDFIKQEGDGAAPAGVFQLGAAFGEKLENIPLSWPYKVVQESDIFVDDSRSNYYNQWVNTSSAVIKDWNSHELMKRLDGLYNRGLIVKHNMNPVKPTYGSAIFIHIWRSKKQPTLGCTATTQKNIELLLSWLQLPKQPLLIQLPLESGFSLTENNIKSDF